MHAAKIRQFIARNFLFSEDPGVIRDDQSLMASGTLDSTGILELIMYVEEQFQVKVPDQDMLPENFDSVQAIAAYVARKISAA